MEISQFTLLDEGGIAEFVEGLKEGVYEICLSPMNYEQLAKAYFDKYGENFAGAQIGVVHPINKKFVPVNLSMELISNEVNFMGGEK